MELVWITCSLYHLSEELHMLFEKLTKDLHTLGDLLVFQDGYLICTKWNYGSNIGMYLKEPTAAAIKQMY